MTMCTASRVKIIADGMEPTEPGEHDVHNRQKLLSGWDQDRIHAAKIGQVGVGGYGSFLRNTARLGIGHLTFCDPDNVELPNLNRQEFFPEQKFCNKAISMLDNLQRHCTTKTTLEAYGMTFQEVIQSYPGAFEDVDILTCFVDNEPTRLAVASYALERDIPVIFAANSITALNGYVFVQNKSGPCFKCINPDDVDEEAHRCADPSVIYIQAAITGIATYAAIALIQGWELQWNYYALILDSDSYAMKRPKRTDCELCARKVA